MKLSLETSAVQPPGADIVDFERGRDTAEHWTGYRAAILPRYRAWSRPDLHSGIMWWLEVEGNSVAPEVLSEATPLSPIECFGWPKRQEHEKQLRPGPEAQPPSLGLRCTTLTSEAFSCCWQGVHELCMSYCRLSSSVRSHAMPTIKPNGRAVQLISDYHWQSIASLHSLAVLNTWVWLLNVTG
jgi:hypothetical protein